MGLLGRLFGGRGEEPPKARKGEDEHLDTKLSAVQRSTWIPETVEGDSDPAASKFSGVAFIPPGDSWPRCGNCDLPMQLLVQLTARQLPAEAPIELGDDLLQLFYCTSAEPMCDVDTEAFFPFKSNASLVRCLAAQAEASTEINPVEDAFPPRSIVGWRRETDYPDPEEQAVAVLKLTEEESNVMYDTHPPTSGDKLGGWPAWVQGIEYPSCSECGTRMQLVLQVDSGDNLPYMFGDAGTGHITQCPDHRNVLAFGWACS